MKRLLKSDKFWLFSILISFAVFHLNVTWKVTGDPNRLTIDLFFWAAILFLLWRRRDRLRVDSDLASAFLGLLLIVLVLVKSISLFWFESSLLKFAPFVAVLGIALLASGFKGLRQYWLELLFSCLMFFPTSGLESLMDSQFQISILTAKSSAYLLYYLGFNTATQSNEVLLSLPQGGNFRALVDYQCTGVPMMLLMLKLSLLLQSFFPMKWLERFFLPMVAVSLGFFLGVIRVSILTLTMPDPAKFDYWHSTEGAQIFSTLSILIFSFLCYSVLQRSSRGAKA